MAVARNVRHLFLTSLYQYKAVSPSPHPRPPISTPHPLFVPKIGGLLGCVVGLRAAVSGITIIALGTSLPDTFASRTAALHDEYADAAIGNVTGKQTTH